MSTYSDKFVCCAKSPSHIVANVAQEHLVKPEDEVWGELYFSSFVSDIFHNPREIFGFKQFALTNIAVELDLEEDFFSFFEGKRAIFDGVAVVDGFWNFGFANEF